MVGPKTVLYGILLVTLSLGGVAGLSGCDSSADKGTPAPTDAKIAADAARNQETADAQKAAQKKR